MAVNSQFLQVNLSSTQTYTVSDNGFNKVKIYATNTPVMVVRNPTDITTDAFLLLTNSGTGLSQVDIPLSAGENIYIYAGYGSATVQLMWYNDDKPTFSGTINLTSN